MAKIIPAILTDDPRKLEQLVRGAEKMGDEAHIDFLDGEFISAVSVAPQALTACNPNIDVEAHLMVKRPDLFVAPFKETRVKRVIFHAEAVDNCDFLIRLFKDQGFAVGIALNPETPLEAILAHLNEVDQVLFLTAKPGKQGNPFQEQVLEKIHVLRRSWTLGTISADGGVNKDNITQVLEAGAGRIVAGSSIWQSPDSQKAYLELKSKAE